MKTHNSAWYQALKYDVKVIKEKDKFYVYIPELQIIVQDADLSHAYLKLEEAKSCLIEQYFELGKQDAIPLPNEFQKKRHMLSIMTPFLLKISIFTIATALLIVTANVSFKYIIEETPERVAIKIFRNFTQTFQSLASNELRPETAERYHRDLKAIARKLKPFTKDLAPLFKCEDLTSTTKE